MSGRLHRVAVAASVIPLALGAAAGPDGAAPNLTALSVASGSAPYAGDHDLLATITPNGDGYRDRALIRFRLDRPASVTVSVVALVRPARTVFRRTVARGAGRHVVQWRPRGSIEARTYAVWYSARDGSGRVEWHGFGRRTGAPVVRVLGIEAAFDRESYAPGELARMTLASDEVRLTVQVRRVSGGTIGGPSADAMNGIPVTRPRELDRPASRDRTRRLVVRVGDWPSGLYYARVAQPDGSAGYAPFVVRPRRLGEHRVAVVLPTFTWQAYNFRDTDGDGHGETWYTGRTRETLLGRPHPGRGVPAHFRSYDLDFLVWLARAEESGAIAGVDFLSDSDLHGVASAATLARAYDLIVFPGHHEYVTARSYALVRGFRDRGGNLLFLSANNFFWCVELRGSTLARTAKWRDRRRPEAALIGVQYIASNRGEGQRPYVVRDAERAKWLFEGTGLRTGSRFGWFGIEVDAKTPASPRNTLVVAEIPDIFGPGRTAQMTYYVTPRGAKVFAAGAFTLARHVNEMPERRLLENLWARLSLP